MTGEVWEYAAVFVGSLALALVLTPLALRVAVRRQFLDHPGEHKVQASAVPYLGGLAIVLAFSLAILVAAAARPPVGGVGDLAIAVGLASALSLIGLFDDLRGVGPLGRVACELLAGIGLWAANAGVQFTGTDATDLLVTVIWVVGITNAFNLLDNMDGLSAGVATIAAASFFVIAVANSQFLVAALSAALAGCALGFLRHNIHPARIYMGDAGSLYLGFLLAYLGLKLRFDAPDDVTFLVPIIVLGVPILDTTLVTISRLRHGRSPFLGGRDHVSHRLVTIGLPVPGAVGTIYVAAASLGVIALVISRTDRVSAYLLAGLIVALGATALAALSRVRVYPADSDRHQKVSKAAR